MGCDFADQLAIQSWCFRTYETHDKVIEALKACDVRCVELTTRHVFAGGKSYPGGPQALVDFYLERGITISGYGLHVFSEGTEADARWLMELARAAGFGSLAADFKPGGVEQAERLAAEYGVKVALHNHGRRHRYGPAWAIEEVLSATSPNIGLCLDTAWAIDSGDDPVALARKHADRLYGVHVKDFVFDRAGKPEDIIVGTGNLDLPTFLGTLKEIGFAGAFTLEYEGDVENPIPATKQCVQAIRKAAKALR